MYPNLKLELWRSGIRQNRLAQMLKLDESMLSRILNGFREPSEEVRCRIAELLRANEAWLFQRADNAKKASGPVPDENHRTDQDRLQTEKSEQLGPGRSHWS